MARSTLHIFIVIFLTIFHFESTLASSKNKIGYVTYHKSRTERFKIVSFNTLSTTNVKNIKIDNEVARALYANKISETGWGFLELETNGNYTDEDQAYAAGLLEGYLTYDLIYKHWFNTVKDFCLDKAPLCKKIQDYINTNQRWVDDMIAKSSNSDDYWYQVKLFYTQMKGLSAGYTLANHVSNRALTFNDILWLNLDGDLEDLSSALDESVKSSGDLNTRSGRVLGSGSCSALIKLLPDSSDLLVSHVTWSGYNTMLRLQKKYVLPYRQGVNTQDRIPGYEMSFSSFPGGIQSGDDFFLISSGIVTLETTIGNSNASRWQFVKPVGQVLEVVRTMVANRLGHCGMSWSNVFTRYNSGTYNNQWMIVDYKRFKTGTMQADLKDNLIWVLEQIPGLIVAKDMTSTLRQQSYWPSYNVPSFTEVFKQSGQEAYVDKFGDWFTYDQNPRAKIFRRDHVKVHDTTSMMTLMRYNNFKHDPLSRCNCTPPYSAENAISARCDMNPTDGIYPFAALGHRSHGATDAKITSKAMFMNLEMIAISGPVHNAEIPAFQWSRSDFKQLPHMGHPDLWQFSPVIHSWLWK